MGAVSKKAFWQVADHFLGVQREKEIRVTPANPTQSSIREEVRAETILKTKEEVRAENILKTKEEPFREKVLQTMDENVPDKSSYGPEHTQPTETNFTKLVRQCEQRLHDSLKYHNMALTPKRAERVPLQAERAAAFIRHVYGDRSVLPPEKETVNFCLRAKYELNRLPEIQQDLMEQGEDNAFRAYRIADRLASIEGRLYLEARAKGLGSLFPSYDAKRELARHREQLPHLIQDLKQTHFLSDTAAQHCAQDILRYKETHGEKPSEGQMFKMIQISRELENKNYSYRSSSRDPAEIEFLRRREGDLLFRHGLGYDASRDLERSQVQVNKSFEVIQRQREQERVHSKSYGMDLSM